MKLLGSRILITPLPPPEMKGSIHLAKQKQEPRAVVHSIGAKVPEGVLNIGDIVVHAQLADYENTIKIDGKEYRLIEYSDIYAIYGKQQD